VDSGSPFLHNRVLHRSSAGKAGVASDCLTGQARGDSVLRIIQLLVTTMLTEGMASFLWVDGADSLAFVLTLVLVVLVHAFSSEGGASGSESGLSAVMVLVRGIMLLMLNMGTVDTCNVRVCGGVGRVCGNDSGMVARLVGVVDSLGLSNVAGGSSGHTGTGTIIGEANRGQERAWVHITVLGAGGAIEVLVVLMLVIMVAGFCRGGGSSVVGRVVGVVVGGIGVTFASNLVDQVCGLVLEVVHRRGLVDGGVGGDGVVGRVGHVESA